MCLYTAKGGPASSASCFHCCAAACLACIGPRRFVRGRAARQHPHPSRMMHITYTHTHTHKCKQLLTLPHLLYAVCPLPCSLPIFYTTISAVRVLGSFWWYRRCKCASECQARPAATLRPSSFFFLLATPASNSIQTERDVDYLFVGNNGDNVFFFVLTLHSSIPFDPSIFLRQH